MNHVRKTSIEAYREIEATGLLSKRKWEVYATLYHFGPLTAFECYQIMLHSNPHLRDHSVTPRFSELKVMGVISEVGEKLSVETGHNVYLWDVTDRLPIKLERKEAQEKWFVLFSQSMDERSRLFKTKEKALAYKLKNQFASVLHEVILER